MKTTKLRTKALLLMVLLLPAVLVGASYINGVFQLAPGVTSDEGGNMAVTGSVTIGITAHGSVVSGTVDFSPGVHTITVAGDQTWTFSGWPAAGKEGQITVYVTNGGSATITGLDTPIYSGGGTPALTAAGKDTLVFTSIDGGTIVMGFVTGLDQK